MDIIKQRISLLEKLDLGNPVAESDEHLVDHFYKTRIFRQFVQGKVDIVAGDKGSGKTSLCMYVHEKANEIKELADIEIVQGFNPKGRTVFQRLCEAQLLEEDRYTAIWKTYILSLAGNWVLQFFETEQGEPLGEQRKPDEVDELNALLQRLGLRALGEKPSKIFIKVLDWIKKYLRPQEAGIKVEVSESGATSTGPYIAFGQSGSDTESDNEWERLAEFAKSTAEHEDALELLDSIFGDLGISIWILLDRLDDAFMGRQDVEIPALKGLLRTYADLSGLSHIKLKIFLRRDLFRRIVISGFVNLTHVNAKKTEITWRHSDLQGLLLDRLKSNEFFQEHVQEASNLKDPYSARLLSALLPTHVEAGRQNTWQWILTKTRDGNGSVQPRNLVDLLILARDAQEERESYAPYHKKFPLFTSDAMQDALDQLSIKRVGDTMLAEASKEVAACIQGLREGKSEHNDETLAEAFGVSTDDVQVFIDVLVHIGFLEARNGTYRVPILYRKGLDIRQGKAF